LPFGATSIHGYSGRLSDAPVSARRFPAVVRTSGVLTRPEVMSISPLLSGVTVGYQRPPSMFGPRLHRFVTGSKMCVWTIPLSCWSRFPPAMNMRPSGRCCEAAAEDVEAVVEVYLGLRSRRRVHTVARVWSWLGYVSVALSPIES
jgi:hypothetical protein